MNKVKSEGKIELKISKENLKILKNLTAFIVSAGVIIVSGLTVFMPTLSKVFQLRKELNKTREDLASLNEKANFLEGTDYYAIVEKQATIEKVLLAEKDVEAIFKNLKILAGESGVILESIEVVPGEISTPGASLKEGDKKKAKGEKKEGDLEIINYDVKARGKFENLKNFFASIHLIQPVMAIGGISLSLPEDLEQQVPVSLTIKTYVLEKKGPIANIKTPLPGLSEEEEEIYKDRILKLLEFD